MGNPIYGGFLHEKMAQKHHIWNSPESSNLMSLSRNGRLNHINRINLSIQGLFYNEMAHDRQHRPVHPMVKDATSTGKHMVGLPVWLGVIQNCGW
jgi:hypothetical protein